MIQGSTGARAFRCLVTGVLLAFAAKFAAAAPPPAEAFGSIPAVYEMELSPDGRHIAAVQAIDGRPQVVIYDFGSDDNVKRYAFKVDDGIAHGVVWSGNSRVICLYHETQRLHRDLPIMNWGRAISVSPEARDPVRLMNGGLSGMFNTNTASLLAAPLEGNDVYVQALRLSASGVTLGVFKVDLASGASELTAPGTQGTFEWVLDDHGRPAARIDHHDVAQEDDVMVPSASGDWRQIANFDATVDKQSHLFGITQDTGLALGKPNDQGRRALYRLDPGTGKVTDTLFSDSEYDLGGVVMNPWTNRVVGIDYSDDNQQYRYFNPAWANVQARIQAVLPGQTVEIVSTTLAGDRYIVRTVSPQQPAIFRLFVPAKGRLESLLASYPQLSSSDLGTVKIYPYKSRDGLIIHSYLTLPPGRAARNLPSIVFPHGGPEARDDSEFNWWAQFMATRGYAVLQPNFRGSSGYGATFREAGNGQWGRKMQDDLTDGVKQLIADGITDSKRVCIVGASYGGYAALAGATFTPDLYACAISVAGVSDLPGMLELAESHHDSRSEIVRYMTERMGGGSDDERQLQSASPVFHAENVKIPVLLLHCDKDVTVPIDQTEEEYHALLKAKKNVQFLKLEGDDHYLELSSTRTAMLKAIESFLATHLGDAPAMTAAQ